MLLQIQLNLECEYGIKQTSVTINVLNMLKMLTKKSTKMPSLLTCHCFFHWEGRNTNVNFRFACFVKR